MRAALAASAVLLAAAAAHARADAAPPSDYWIRAHPDTGAVTIYLSGDRACADGPLLRRDLGTGVVVAITTCQDEQTFVDQCVPAGQYQYGLATPYRCSQWGSAFYAQQVVQAPPAPCVRTVAAPAPAAAAELPWGDERVLCESTYPGPGGGGGGCATGGAVLGTNLALLLAGLAVWRRRPGRRRG